jgi:hypothetical protein
MHTPVSVILSTVVVHISETLEKIYIKHGILSVVQPKSASKYRFRSCVGSQMAESGEDNCGLFHNPQPATLRHPTPSFALRLTLDE